MGREHDREGRVSEMDNVETILGACRFCGQTKAIHPLNPYMTDEEADAIATEDCDCPAAKFQREKEGKRERAKAAVKTKFGPGEGGERWVNEETLHFLEAAVDLVIEEQVESVQVKVSHTVTAKIHLTGKGNVKIEKTKTTKSAIEA